MSVVNGATTTSLYTDATGVALPSFYRFCSGYLSQNGFVNATGQRTPVYFAPEESENTGRGWPVTPDGTALGLDGLGSYAKESVIGASQYQCTNSAKAALISYLSANLGFHPGWGRA
jgi:glycerophosphoryl diester phosphodiesterase